VASLCSENGEGGAVAFQNVNGGPSLGSRIRWMVRSSRLLLEEEEAALGPGALTG